ncbi:neural-cadherin 2-like 5 [Homarus americanus]|uniref:Neural-cadherin 2-like 5 n=1 Tax=Homarus americanus TaxID=6706 RepID=A0A8J5JNE0_HOMAM|nr:neural-cadherin 2-like 5 [Homarus americanus]
MDTNATQKTNPKSTANATHHVSLGATQHSTYKDQAAVSDAYSVVEAGTRAMVGPRVDVLDMCRCDRYNTPQGGHYTCTPHTCLNGGRCLPTVTGYRCICPHGTEDSRCKILSRHFEGVKEPKDSVSSSSKGGPVIDGWAWLPPIPPCTEVHLSLEFLTSSQDATILYSGPRKDSRYPAGEMGDLLALELRDGRPSLVLDLGAGPVALTINASYTVTNSRWHRLDLLWKDEVGG